MAIKIKRFSTEIENMTGNMIYVYNFIGTFIRYIWGDYCEAQARVRQGLARDGSQGERPQSLNPSLELTLNLVDPPTTGSLITLG